MPFMFDIFEYTCPQGHLNKFHLAYPVAEGCIFDQVQPQTPKLPERLPCTQCNYTLVPANLISKCPGHYSEVDFYKFKDQKYTESAAYHEAAHVVISTVERITLRKDGIRIDQKGAGFSHYKTVQPTGVTNVGSDPEREKDIRSTMAGYIAQKGYYRRFFDYLPPAGSSYDDDHVVNLLNEMYSNRQEFVAAKKNLSKDTEELVGKHWHAIEVLAQVLLKKEWKSQAPPSGERRWSTQLAEKKLNGDEVVEVLQQLGLSPTIAS
jgi:hypothetical protein